jgi:hypothetical protein
VKEVGVFLESEIRKAKKLEDIPSNSADKDKSAEPKSGTNSSTNEYRYLLIKCVNQIT